MFLNIKNKILILLLLKSYRMIPELASGIGFATGLGETIYGGIKAGQANRQMNELEKNRPVYSRPDEIKQYLEMAKTGANSNMPGQTQLTQNTEQATQGMLTKLQDSGQLDAGAIQKLYQSELGAYNNLAMQQSQYHQSQQDRLSQALSESAKYSDQEFEYNVNSPWQRKMGRAMNKYEAGQSMLGAGISGMTGAAFSYLGMKGAQNPSESSYGGYSPPATGQYSAPLRSSQSQINTSGMGATPSYFNPYPTLGFGQSSQIDTSRMRAIPNY